jgi:hypothetical protein
VTTNALQAVLDRAVQQPAPEKPSARKRSDAPSAPPKPERVIAKTRAKPAREPRHEDAESSRHSRPVREGKRFVGAHFHPEVARQLKVLAAEDGTTIQELLEQAVDLLFVKNGKTKIGELVRKEIRA